MAFFDFLKGSKPEQKTLEVAFGLHVVSGDLAKAILTGTSPTHVVTVQNLLGDTLGRGWKGVKGVWYNAFNRPASKYKFHPGKQAPNPTLFTFTADASTDVISAAGHTLANGDMLIFPPGDLPAPLQANKIYYARDVVASTSFKVALTSGGSAINITTAGSGTLQFFENDPDSGIDPVFDQDTPHSNVAWIRVEAPSGSEVGIPDADLKNNPPAFASCIVETQLGDIYDDTGAIDTADVLIDNPADVIAFGCKEIRGYPNSRVDWESLDVLRQACNATYTPNHTAILPSGVGLTGRYYSGTNFDTLVQRRVDPVLQYTQSAGAPALDLSPTSFSVRWEGRIHFKYSEIYTFFLTHNDGGRLYVGNMTTPIIDQWSTTGTHSATFNAVAGEYIDIKVEWKNAAGDSALNLEWQSTKQRRQTVPQERLYPLDETQKRFLCNIAFTARTSFDDFLRAVLFTCNGSFQDVDGKLRFFTIDDLTPSFAFDESNTVKNSIVFKPRFSQSELLNLPNRFIGEGRDLESRYLQPFDPPLELELTDLQGDVGRIIDETLLVGNVTRAQGVANLRHYAKLRTGQMIAELDGMPQTYPVLPGDLVTVTDSISGWDEKQFLVLEARDHSIDAGADNRSFKLLEWEPDALEAGDPPSDLDATWNSTETYVELEWTNNGGTGNNVVERKPDGGSYATIAVLGSTNNAYIDTGVSPGPDDETYIYRIRNTSVTGYSNEDSVIVPLDAGDPPSGLSATWNGTLTRAELSWTNNGAGGDNIVERKPSGGSYSTIATLASSATSHNDTTLTPGEFDATYIYRVRNTGVSGYSNEDDVVVPGTSGGEAPSDLWITNFPWLSGQFDLQWTNNGAAGSNVVQRSPSGASVWDTIVILNDWDFQYTDWPGPGCWDYRVYNDDLPGEYTNTVNDCYFE